MVGRPQCWHYQDCEAVKTELEPTGERVIEDAYRRSLGAYVIYLFHLASYRFAESYCRGQAVLDLGCGSGYGAAHLAQTARSVDGVDVSAEAIDFARKRYSRPNLVYQKIDPDVALPFPDAVFDVVLSFQVIEHVVDVDGYLREAYRVLRPGGYLIVITPDRRHRLLPGQKPWNRWHLREYSAKSLTAVAARTIPVEEILTMGAPWPIAGVEHRRYRWTKWLTLPFTLPFWPEVVRRRSLDLLHSIKGQGAAVEAETCESSLSFDFDERAIVIAKEAPHSTNLVLVARRPPDAP
jgi:SAM-dependent methyltransferase